MATLGKSKKAAQRSWRPDFREIQTLPDTKVIRTGFLLNFVGISLAVICMTLYGYREYTLQNLRKSVNDLQVQVASATDGNRRTLDVNKQFRQNAEVVAEAVAFDAEPVAFHSFVSEVGDALQMGMQLDSIKLESSTDRGNPKDIPLFQIELDGKVLEGAPATPAQVLSNFQAALRKLPVMQDQSFQMEMTRFSRNNEFGYFDFTLLIEITVKKTPAL